MTVNRLLSFELISAKMTAVQQLDWKENVAILLVYFFITSYNWKLALIMMLNCNFKYIGNIN